MEISPRAARGISVFAWVMAAAGTVIGQVHALARFVEHPNDLVESPLTRLWAVPATQALQPLLDWSDPWTVYVTYGKIWAPVCVAFLAAAYLVYRRRRPAGAERRLWQVQLGAYAAMTVSVVGDYFTPWWMEQMFIFGIAAMLVIGFGGRRARDHDVAQRLPAARHPGTADDLHSVHVRRHVGDLARQCAASTHVGLGHRRSGRSPP